MARDHKPFRHRNRVLAAAVTTLTLGGTALGGVVKVPHSTHGARHAPSPHRPKTQVAPPPLSASLERGDPHRGPSSGTPRPRTEHRGHRTGLSRHPLAEIEVSAAGKPKGHDVSSHQKNVDWSSARAKGARFVYVKATESTTYRNPYFSRQYNGSREAGLIRGAYHFALPHKSSGRAQAAYFVNNGGGWRADGWTLPPALDIEYNPYDKKKKCYGLSDSGMVGWIKSFSDEVKRLTGRRPVIYTNTNWWKACTGNSAAFAANHPLWLARYSSAGAGELPAGWKFWTIWQHDNGSGSLPGDQNLFNGSMNRLKKFAKG